MTDSPVTRKVADKKKSTENNNQATSFQKQAEIKPIRILSPRKNQVKKNLSKAVSPHKKVRTSPNNKRVVSSDASNKVAETEQKNDVQKNTGLHGINSLFLKNSDVEIKNSLNEENDTLINNSEMKSQNIDKEVNLVISPVLQMEIGLKNTHKLVVESDIIEKTDRETENHQNNLKKIEEKEQKLNISIDQKTTPNMDTKSSDENSKKSKRISFYKTKDREKKDLLRQTQTLGKSLIKGKTNVKSKNTENSAFNNPVQEEKQITENKKETSKENVYKSSKTLLKENLSGSISKMVRFRAQDKEIKTAKNFSNKNAIKTNLLGENDPRLNSRTSNLVFVNNNNFLDDGDEENAPEGEPAAEEPAAEEPAAEEPAAEEPAAEEPAAEEPAAEEPAAEEPVAEEPVAEEPVAEEPVAQEPAAEEPVAEEKKSEISAKKSQESKKGGEVKTSQVMDSSSQKKSIQSKSPVSASALATGDEKRISTSKQSSSEHLTIIKPTQAMKEGDKVPDKKIVEKDPDEPYFSKIKGLEIIEVDKKRQYIRIENTTRKDISLSSKVLLQRLDDSIYTVFLFPQYTLLAKNVVTVWSNGSPKKVEDETNLVHHLQSFWACPGPTSRTILCEDVIPYLWSKAKRSAASKELDECDEVIKKVKRSKEETGAKNAKTRVVKSFDMSEFCDEMDEDPLKSCAFYACLNKKPVKQMDLTCETLVSKAGEVFDCDKLLKERKRSKLADSNSFACDCEKFGLEKAKRKSKKSGRSKNCGCESDDMEFEANLTKNTISKNNSKQKKSSKKKGCAANVLSDNDCSCSRSKKKNHRNDSSSDDGNQKKNKKLKGYESSLTNNSSKSVEECLKLLEQTKKLMDDDEGGDCDGFCSRLKKRGKPCKKGANCSDSDDDVQNVKSKNKKSKFVEKTDVGEYLPKKNKQKKSDFCQKKEKDSFENSDDDEYELNNFLLCDKNVDESASTKNFNKRKVFDQRTQNNSIRHKEKYNSDKSSNDSGSENENDFENKNKLEEKQKSKCADYTKKQTKLDQDFLLKFDERNVQIEYDKKGNDCVCNDWDFSNESFEIRQPAYENDDYTCKVRSRYSRSNEKFNDYTKKQTTLDKSFFAEFGSQSENATRANVKKVSCVDIDLSDDSFKIIEPKSKKKTTKKNKKSNKQETKTNKKDSNNCSCKNNRKISNKNSSSNRDSITISDSDTNENLDSISEKEIVSFDSEKSVSKLKGILKNKQISNCENKKQERFDDEDSDFSFNKNKLSKNFLDLKLKTTTYTPKRIEDKLKYLREMNDINDSFNNNITDENGKTTNSSFQTPSIMEKNDCIPDNNNNNNKLTQNPSSNSQKHNNRTFVTKRSADSKQEITEKSQKNNKTSKFDKTIPHLNDESPGAHQKVSKAFKEERNKQQLNFSRRNSSGKSTSQERKAMFVKTNLQIKETKKSDNIDNVALKTFTKASFEKTNSKNKFDRFIFKPDFENENSPLNEKFDEADPRIRARSSNMIPVNNNRLLDDGDEEEGENPPEAEEAAPEPAEEAAPEPAEEAAPEAAEEAAPEAAEEAAPEAAEEAAPEAAEETAPEPVPEAAEDAVVEDAPEPAEEAATETQATIDVEPVVAGIEKASQKSQEDTPEGKITSLLKTSKESKETEGVKSKRSEGEKIEQKQSKMKEEDFFVPNGYESKVKEFKIVDVDKKRQFIRIKNISEEILESSSNALVQRFKNSIYTAFFFTTSSVNPGDIVTLWSQDAKEKVVNNLNYVHTKQAYWACVGPSTTTFLEKWDKNVFKHFWTETTYVVPAKKTDANKSTKQKFKSGEKNSGGKNIVKSFDLSDLCNDSDDDLFGCSLYCCSNKPIKKMVLSCDKSALNSSSAQQNNRFDCDRYCESLKYNKTCSTDNCECERYGKSFGKKGGSKKGKGGGCGCNGVGGDINTKNKGTPSLDSMPSNNIVDCGSKKDNESRKAEKLKPSKEVKDCMKLLNITDKLLDDEFDMTSSGSKRFEEVDKRNKKGKKLFEGLDSCFSNDEDEKSLNNTSESEVGKKSFKNCGNDRFVKNNKKIQGNDELVGKCCQKNSKSLKKDKKIKNCDKDTEDDDGLFETFNDRFDKKQTKESGDDDEIVKKCCEKYMKSPKTEKKTFNEYSSNRKNNINLTNKDSLEKYKIENYLACNSEEDDDDEYDCGFDPCAICKCSGDKKDKYKSVLKSAYKKARIAKKEDYTLEGFLKCSDSDKDEEDNFQDTCGFCRCNRTKNNIQRSEDNFSEYSEASDNDDHQNDSSCGCCKMHKMTSESEDGSSCSCSEHSNENSHWK